MDPLGGEPGLRPLPIFELNQPKDLEQFAIGSDSDIGGLSSVQLALLEEESTESLTNLNSLVRRGVFRGVLRTELGPDAKQTGILKRGGYAGFRTKVRFVCLFDFFTFFFPKISLELRKGSSNEGVFFLGGGVL